MKKIRCLLLVLCAMPALSARAADVMYLDPVSPWGMMELSDFQGCVTAQNFTESKGLFLTLLRTGVVRLGVTDDAGEGYDLGRAYKTNIIVNTGYEFVVEAMPVSETMISFDLQDEGRFLKAVTGASEISLGLEDNVYVYKISEENRLAEELQDCVADLDDLRASLTEGQLSPAQEVLAQEAVSPNVDVGGVVLPAEMPEGVHVAEGIPAELIISHNGDVELASVEAVADGISENESGFAAIDYGAALDEIAAADQNKASAEDLLGYSSAAGGYGVDIDVPAEPVLTEEGFQEIALAADVAEEIREAKEGAARANEVYGAAQELVSSVQGVMQEMKETKLADEAEKRQLTEEKKKIMDEHQRLVQQKAALELQINMMIDAQKERDKAKKEERKVEEELRDQGVNTEDLLNMPRKGALLVQKRPQKEVVVIEEGKNPADRNVEVKRLADMSCEREAKDDPELNGLLQGFSKVAGYMADSTTYAEAEEMVESLKSKIKLLEREKEALRNKVPEETGTLSVIRSCKKEDRIIDKMRDIISDIKTKNFELSQRLKESKLKEAVFSVEEFQALETRLLSLTEENKTLREVSVKLDEQMDKQTEMWEKMSELEVENKQLENQVFDLQAKLSEAAQDMGFGDGSEGGSGGGSGAQEEIIDLDSLTAEDLP